MEPYFGGSHRAFAEGYARFSRNDVTLFTHPSTFWKWRMQGGFLTLAHQFEQAVAKTGRFDLIVASSMLDTARFVGTARKAIGYAPVVVYMHENQLTYPIPPRADFDATYSITNWVSMTAADLVLFNSNFHREVWFASLPSLLNIFPDEPHGSIIGDVIEKSEVLPVGIDLRRIKGIGSIRNSRPLILWNHRWEFDRGPDIFAAALIDLWKTGAQFNLALAGEQFVSDPTGFRDLKALMGDRVVHYGYASEEEYVALLGAADIVVSTSRQEFFGISVAEAVYSGAFPVLPDHLVYPERIPPRYRSYCLYTNFDDLSEKLLWALSHRDDAARIASELRPAMARFDWSVVAPAFDRRFEVLSRML